MKVIGKNILVEEAKAKEQLDNGIFIAEAEVGYTDTTTAKVISVGAEVKEVSVGDTVLYRVRSGVNFEQNGKKYRTLEATEIVAVL